MNMRCIIIEDEPLAIEKLEDFVAQIPFLTRVASFNNALNGLTFLKTNSIDLVFLDIQMEKLTGIQFLETIQSKPYVIITSAYSEYALKGYELQVFDYLLKPYSFERFLQAVNNVFDDWKAKQTSANKPSHIFIRTEYRIENVCLDDILYIEGMQGYLRIVTSEKKIMSKITFTDILKQLPNDKFVQVHKSWVLAIAKIETIEHNRIKIGDKLIPIGDTYRDSFFKIIGK